MGSFFCLKTAISVHCALLRARIAIFTETGAACTHFLHKTPLKNQQKKHKNHPYTHGAHSFALTKTLTHQNRIIPIPDSS